MTHLYQWYSVPHELAVVCPHCAGRALVHRQDTADHGQPLVGTLVCVSCHRSVEGHTVIWPKDAFFRCDVRGHELWAWSEDHARAIREFVASKTRKTRSPALLHLPEFFLRAKQREAIVEAIDRLLAAE